MMSMLSVITQGVVMLSVVASYLIFKENDILDD
jgi:hypothetical protein